MSKKLVLWAGWIGDPRNLAEQNQALKNKQIQPMR
jgi:hypothetical protein